MDGITIVAAGLAIAGASAAFFAMRGKGAPTNTGADAKNERPRQEPKLPAAPRSEPNLAAVASKDAKAVPSVWDLEGEEDSETTQVTAMPSTPGKPPSLPAVEVFYEEGANVDEATAPVDRILVSAEGVSDHGHVRRTNEDSLMVWPEQGLYIVADGMGGYEGGEVASALAVQTMRDVFEHSTFEGELDCPSKLPPRARELACAMQASNQAVLARARSEEKLSQMGTTMIAARFSPNKQRAYIAHVGDSRAYRLRGNKLRQLTTDHTMGLLGVRGPEAQHLFQAIGLKPKILIDLIIDKPRPDDIYMFCTDGLTKMASDERIQEILSNECDDVEAAVYTLIELAKDHGGKDNVTVIVVKVVEVSRGVRPDPS